MDFTFIISTFQGWFFLLAVFGAALAYSMFKGRQALINLILGAYLALFLYQKFPWLENLQGMVTSDQGRALVALGVFAAFIFFAAWLFARLMPREYDEKPFESLHIKLLLAVMFTVIVLTLDNQFLPLSAFINTGTPLPDIIQADSYTFWWLLLPLVALFLL